MIQKHLTAFLALQEEGGSTVFVLHGARQKDSLVPRLLLAAVGDGALVG